MPDLQETETKQIDNYECRRNITSANAEESNGLSIFVPIIAVLWLKSEVSMICLRFVACSKYILVRLKVRPFSCRAVKCLSVELSLRLTVCD